VATLVICLFGVAGFIILGCQDDSPPPKPMAKPMPMPKLELPTPPIAAMEEPLSALLKPSHLSPIAGFRLPEDAELIRKTESLVVYQVNGTLEQLEEYSSAQGHQVTKIFGATGFALKGTGVIDIRFVPNGRGTRIMFITSEILDGPDQQQEAQVVIEIECSAEKQQRVKAAIKAGERDLRKVLGPGFRD
jgi:hypothetical protein